jgi:quinol monooxygenase YgiN
MSVVIVATIYPKPDQRAEVLAALEQAIARVHAEDAGCELYALHEAGDRLVMIEKWADEAAVAAHGSGAALGQFAAALKGKLTSAPDVVILTPHPAGTDEQGTL